MSGVTEGALWLMVALILILAVSMAADDWHNDRKD